MNKRVLLGMSGGIDSSVSAMLLKDAGYEVTGITFLFSGDTISNKLIVNSAKELSEKMKIKHIVADFRDEFRVRIIDYFINEYKNGRTPFPCAVCNPNLKFYYLEQFAKQENCDCIATGHYVQVKNYAGFPYIHKGVDEDKDQSFFLWGLGKNILEKVKFPLGGFIKTEVREIAKRRGFQKLSEKKDSLGICFIDGNDYRKFLKKEGVFSLPGNFVSPTGEVLGKHNGIYNYTIGQRRGLGLNLNFPVFVAEIRVDANEIVLAKFEDLYRKRIIVNNTQFVDIEEIKPTTTYQVKVRYRLQLTPCKINILNEQRAEVELLNSEAMIANGQTAVFYDGERLIGGGFIESSE